MRIKLILAVTVLLCGICSFSCKKSATVGNDFTYTGMLLIGDSIHFTAIAPSGSTVRWSFGDGFESVDRNPIHAYSSVDSFMVTLTLNQDSIHAIKKMIYIGLNPTPTYLIAGLRHWHHTYYSQVRVTVDSVQTRMFTYADTQFAITYIDPLTILIGDEMLHYTSTNTDSSLSFSFFVDDHRHSDLKFYYNSSDYVGYSISSGSLNGVTIVTYASFH